jgi:triacylglycerol lipase
MRRPAPYLHKLSPRHYCHLRTIQGSRRQEAPHAPRIVHFRHVAPYSSRVIGDPRLDHLANPIHDEFAVVKSQYSAPRYPVVLAHGLLGFDELRVAGPLLPGVHYWRGITEALRHAGVSVFTTSVPASASIEERATVLRDEIIIKLRTATTLESSGESSSNADDAVNGVRDAADAKHANGINIIAHSMGGLDARYMISRLSCPVPVRSLTTIATPHRGSAVADYVFQQVGKRNVPRVYRAMEAMGLEIGGFNQLTRAYMNQEFNPATPDQDGVRYFSYGAAIKTKPHWWSMFRQPHRILMETEGPNDGLVSVESSRWGGEAGYKGTLVDVNHLDLINWTNRLRWLMWKWMGQKRNFNALAFYLSICDMLAKEGL